MLRFFLSSFFLFVGHFSFSQPVIFEHLTQNDGLPSPTVTAVLQDSYGFMWFGSRRGLVKYDGYSFTVFDNISTEKSERITNFFFRNIVQVDDTTLLMVFNGNGFYRFNLNTEKFKLILNNSSKENFENVNTIMNLVKDRENNVWLGTRNGLMSYDPKTNAFSNYPLDVYPEFKSSKSTQYVSSIKQDEKGNLWMFCSDGYIATFDVKSKKYQFIKYSNSAVAKSLFHHGGNLLLDKHNTVWIGTEYEGIFTYDRASGKIKQYSKENGKISSNIIMSFCEDFSQTIWAGTDGGGLLRFNREKDDFEVFKNYPVDPNSLSGNAIYTIYEGKDQILWVGTYAAGVNIFKHDKQKFHKVTSQGAVGKRLSYKSVLSFAEAPDGSILIGTDGGGLNVFHPETGIIDVYYTSNSVIHSNILNTLYFDKAGYLWIGSYGKGFCRYSYSSRGLHLKSNVFLDGKGVWNIIEDKNRNLWIGALDCVYSISLNEKGDILSEPIVRLKARFGVANSILVDSKQQLWISTNACGLYNRKKNSFENIQADKNKPNSLTNSSVTSFYQDRKGNYWIGNELGGISKLLDFKKNSVQKVANYSTYFRSANAILEDKNNNLWLSTNNGIVLLKNEKDFVHFSMEDGLQNKEFNVGASLVAKNGTMYFGGTEGFNYFDPNNIKYNTSTPQVYITELKLFNHTLIQNTPFQGKIYLNKPAFSTKEITLDYDENVLSIGFSALDFTASNRNSYSYKLEGFDKNWFLTDASKRQVTYTNLPPGDYVFRVMGANNDGFWNKDATLLNIHILPPWWMTWWFRALMGIAVITGFFAFYFWRTYAIKKKNAELKLLVEQKTSELRNVNDSLIEINEEVLVTNERLEAQNREVILKSDRIVEQQTKIVAQNTELNKLNETKDKFFSIIAHDLRNPVSALHSISDLLVENFGKYSDAQKEEYAQMLLESSSNLKKLTVDLLDWATSQTKHYQIKPIAVEVHWLTQQTIKTLFTQASQKKILISDHTEKGIYVLADEKMVDTIIRNITSNAIKYSPNGSVISIYNSISDDGQINITIEGQGVGMTEEQLQKLFSIDKIESSPGTEKEQGAGLGLVICKEFVELNNGKLTIESTPQKGTKVHILLPQAEIPSQLVEKKDIIVQQQPNPIIQIQSKEDVSKEVAMFTNRKILIIDDETNARKVLREYLSEHFEIYEAENGRQGLQMAQVCFPEIVVCDLNMPFMNGFEFCSRLKNDPATSHIMCIILTGQAELDLEKRAIEAGADEFLTKPYDAPILVRRIVNQLKTRDQVRKQFSNETDYNIKAIAKDKMTQEFLEKCVSYIEQNISNNTLHADDLCQELGLSKTLLYEKIKNLSDLTVNEFIKVIRLKRSLVYLKEGKMNISQIAIEVGFNSLSYFTRSFVKQYGKSPSEYLK